MKCAVPFAAVISVLFATCSAGGHEEDEMQLLTAAEKARLYREKKKIKERERKLRCYTKNKKQLNVTKRENRKQNKKITRATEKISPVAIRVRKHRETSDQKKRKHRQYQAKYREGKTMSNDTCTPDKPFLFQNRMQKYRLLKKIKEIIPGTPSSQKKILKAVMQETPPSTSPVTDAELSFIIVSNIKNMVHTLKKKRSDKARVSMDILTASVSGENICECRTKVKAASQLGLRSWRISGGYKKRTSIITSERACYTNTSRKVRSDRMTEDVKKAVYNWWTSPQSSRPTGNKSDVKRHRTGYKTYLSHPTYILVKSQTEVYSEFKSTHSNIKISQRVFERMKPFFVRPMRAKDRNTCCCRKHVECRLLYRRCMDYLRKNGKDQNYDHLNDLVEATMCDKPDNAQFHRLECIRRKCSNCGVSRVPLFSDSNFPTADTSVTWDKYEYVNVQAKSGIRKKLMLVKKTTTAREMFTYFRGLIHDFTSHQFSANWQLEQLSSLKQCLPTNTCLVIHDFSENYKCIDREELQSAYFAKTEVSVHVSVIYRHAVAEYDEVDENTIVSELFFGISPDVNHDHYFVTRVQEAIKHHLDDIGCNVDRMVEFTDGCSCQYKSRTCMGVSSFLCEKLGYTSFHRNFFETSHAKGPQDAAGGLLKRQLDIAVMQGHLIQCAKDVHEYAVEHLKTPKTGIYARRHFIYITDIDRSTVYNFKPVPQNRQVHQLTTSIPGHITVREQSCYTCDNCLIGEHQCTNTHMTGDARELDLRSTDDTTGDASDDVETEGETLTEILSEGDVVAVVADDDVDDYFLLKLSKTPYTLPQEVNDAWGNTFPANSNVVEGLYLQKYTKRRQIYYKIIKHKTAVVYSSVICYVLENKVKDGVITVTEEEHLDIIGSVERLKDDFF